MTPDTVRVSAIWMSFEYKTDVQEHQGEATKAKVRRNVTKNKRQ